jgi:acetylornithine deacetylase/succinyl-diaminopimelate desuccinylase-like protein
MNEILNYIDSNKDNFLGELIEFLKIPSISSEEKYKPDVLKAADWLANHIKSIGISDVKVHETEGHPIVFAQWLEAGENAPTVLVYGHYDVQPVDPLELWDSPPFEPVIKGTKIYGRGTCDDKGQLFAHLKSIESHLKINGKLPVNIKLIFEGEEECGGEAIEHFVKTNPELLKCDTVLVSDTEWYADGLPSICYGLRGISYFEITVTGPDRDLHSGTYGGTLDNPVNTLCWLVSQMHDKYGRVTIPGFYDSVIPLTQRERDGYKLLPFNEEHYCKELGIKATNGEFGYTTLERAWARPTLDLNGIFGGYTGDGAKTIIPSKASAKLSMRLVPNQTHDEIAAKFEDYIQKLAPETVKVDVKYLHGGNPFMVGLESKSISAALEALEEAVGVKPVFMRDGGSIPIVGLFQIILNAPTVLMGLGLPDDNIHSPNEKFDLRNFFSGIKASAIFLDKLAKI